MSKAFYFLTLAACATALVVAPVVSSAKVKSTHHKKIRHHGFAPAFHPRPVFPAAAPNGDVCPGNARSFDCKIWPPPFDQDPDRKQGGTDSG